MKYLKEFNSVDQLKRHYENINFAIPNVFQFNNNDELKLEFNDNETIVTVYDINHNISGPTNLWTTYNGDIYESIYVDNVKVNNVNYPLVKTDLSEGKHIIKFKLKDKENLGDSAPVFYNECLIYAHIPSCFKTIKNNAFNHCSGLKAIIIPNSIESIEQSGIAYCDNLEYVKLSENLTNLTLSVISSPKLKSIIIPDKVTSISTAFFADMNQIEYIELGKGITQLPNGIFGSHNKLKNIKLTNSLITIGNAAFAACTSLETINIPESVTSIGDGSFANCTNLTHVNILNDSITIADTAFKDCTNLDNETKEKILQVNPNCVFSYYWYIGETAPADPNSAPGLITPVLTGNSMNFWHELGLGWHIISVDNYNAIHGTGNHLYTTFNGYSADNVYSVTIDEPHDYYLVVPHGAYFKDGIGTTFYFNEYRIGTTEIDGMSYDVYKLYKYSFGDEFNLFIYL